jgi:uncharacterized protein (DUF697 family)
MTMYIPPYLAKHLKDHAAKIAHYMTGEFKPEDRGQAAAEVRKLSAIAGAAIAPMPIPFADIWTITPVQMAMVQAIGNIYGYKLNGRNLKAAFGTVAGGWLGQQTCLALFKIGLPGAGGFGGAAFVYVWTHGIGRAAEVFFRSGMLATTRELDVARRQGIADGKNQQAEHSDMDEPDGKQDDTVEVKMDLPTKGSG